MRAIIDHGPQTAPPVEVAVEEAPLLPEGWIDEVPASSIHPLGHAYGHRLVLYRLPLMTRSGSGAELEDNIWEVTLHRLAEAWDLSPEEIDPRPH